MVQAKTQDVEILRELSYVSYWR